MIIVRKTHVSLLLTASAMLAVCVLSCMAQQPGSSTGWCMYADGVWRRCGTYPTRRPAPPPAQPKPDPAVVKQQQEEAARQAAEAERQRQIEEERRKAEEFKRDRDAAARMIKDPSQADPSLKEAPNTSLKDDLPSEEFKTDTPDATLKGVPPDGVTATPNAKRFVRIGAAAAVRGEVYWLTDDRKKVPIHAGSTIMLNARIVTGPTGHMQVLLLDETVFTLGANSDMVLDDFVYDPNSTAGKATANFAKGTFRYVTGKVVGPNPDRLRFKLPLVAGGIRGTDIEGTVRPDGSGYIKLFSGEIDLTVEKTGEAIVISPGEMITFSANGLISKPRKMLLVERKPTL